MATLKIGLAQTRQTNDLDTNAETILRFLEQAAQAGVQIVCFPETQTVGYRADIVVADAPVPVERLTGLHKEISDFCGRAGMACQGNRMKYEQTESNVERLVW